MLTRIHQKLGTTGFVIAIVALITALGGTALAASGALSGKQKKEVEKIAKKFAGKPGPAGATGPAGTPGTNGTNGKDGAPGKEGPEGKQGLPGQDGTTGFTKTLPEGKTETGHWSAASPNGTRTVAAISFNIPLAKALGENEVHYIGQTGNGTTCPGTEEEPEAEPGNFCVYSGFTSGIEGAIIVPSFAYFQGGHPSPGAFESGAMLFLLPTAETEEERFGDGTWAVTAPEEP